MPYINDYQFAEAAPRVYLTHAALRADPAIPGDEDGPELALCVGGAAAFDGTYGLYAWNKDSTAADNNGTVLKPTNTDSDGRWILVLP